MKLVVYARDGSILTELDAKGVDRETGYPLISDIDFDSRSFQAGVFSCLDFELCGFDASNWTNSDLYRVRFFGDILRDANFTEAGLRQVEFYGAHMCCINFQRCSLSDVAFQAANLKDADFSGATLQGVRFGRDNVGGTTSLQGALFQGADFADVSFDGVDYNRGTRFPDGFKPAHCPGLILQT
jgi:uncharacterized protein YjbI with pentapeptide repeats